MNLKELKAKIDKLSNKPEKADKLQRLQAKLDERMAKKAEKRA
jgi:hypothetical protein